MDKWLAYATALTLAVLAPASAAEVEGPHLVRGSVPLDKGPDGNSVFLDAPSGLILVDTGRHPAHAAKLLAYARERRRPIVAIVNTHWHLDHTTGNWDIRQAYPAADVYATTAIEGALKGYLRQGRENGDKALADPQTPPDRKAAILRARSVIDNPERLRPTRPVLQSKVIRIGGLPLQVHVAPYAATEADLWLYDPRSRTAIVGDLVVGLVPFLDTACPDGWAKALDRIAATPFRRLVPGHGEPMSRQDFRRWQRAFVSLLKCARSSTAKATCVAGWKAAAAPFIPSDRSAYVEEALNYYIDTRLRSSPEEQGRYCPPTKPAT